MKGSRTIFNLQSNLLWSYPWSIKWKQFHDEFASQPWTFNASKGRHFVLVNLLTLARSWTEKSSDFPLDSLARCLCELNNGKCGLTDALRRAFWKAIFFLFDICEGIKKASETLLRGRHQRQKAKRLRGNLTLCYKTSFSILRFNPAGVGLRN